jgi:hypothetical protein
MMRRPPKYVHGYIDVRGKPRFYFRRPGSPRVPLPGLPWSPEFMAEYEKCTKPPAKPVVSQIGAEKIVPRSIRALAIAYYDDAAFKALSAATTQRVYKNIIERFCRETDKDGQAYGDKSAITIKSSHIEKMMEARADKPDSANGLRKVLHEMMKVAKKARRRSDPGREEDQAEEEGRFPSLDRRRDLKIRGAACRRHQGAAGVGARALHRAGAAGRHRDGRAAHQPGIRSRPGQGRRNPQLGQVCPS